MNIIKIMVEGKAKIGKSTIMEIIHDALKQHFHVESKTICGEKFPPNPYLSKRIDALKEKETKVIIFEINHN